MYLYPGFELGVAVSLERGKMVRGREATPGRIKADRHGKLVNYLFIYPIYLISTYTFIHQARAADGGDGQHQELEAAGVRESWHSHPGQELYPQVCWH